MGARTDFMYGMLISHDEYKNPIVSSLGQQQVEL